MRYIFCFRRRSIISQAFKNCNRWHYLNNGNQNAKIYKEIALHYTSLTWLCSVFLFWKIVLICFKAKMNIRLFFRCSCSQLKRGTLKKVADIGAKLLCLMRELLRRKIFKFGWNKHVISVLIVFFKKINRLTHT